MRPCENDLSIGAIGTIGTNGKAVSPLVNNWNLHLINTISQDKGAAHEYTLFFHPRTKKRAQHMNIPRSLIHEAKQARYT